MSEFRVARHTQCARPNTQNTRAATFRLIKFVENNKRIINCSVDRATTNLKPFDTSCTRVSVYEQLCLAVERRVVSLASEMFLKRLSGSDSTVPYSIRRIVSTNSTAGAKARQTIENNQRMWLYDASERTQTNTQSHNTLTSKGYIQPRSLAGETACAAH